MSAPPTGRAPRWSSSGTNCWRRDPRDRGPDVTTLFAMLNIAMFDAINSIEEEYTPYVAQIRNSRGASAEAAAAQAASRCADRAHPDGPAGFDAALQARLARIPRGRAQTASVWGKKWLRECSRMAPERRLGGTPPVYEPPADPRPVAAHASRRRCGVHPVSGGRALRGADANAVPAAAPAAVQQRQVCRGPERGKAGRVHRQLRSVPRNRPSVPGSLPASSRGPRSGGSGTTSPGTRPRPKACRSSMRPGCSRW